MLDENRRLLKDTTSRSRSNGLKSSTSLFSLQLYELSRNAWILFAAKTVRMFSYGFLAVVLMIYLEELGFDDSSNGALFTLTLVGDAVISIILTTHADRWGRKSTLLVGSILAIATSIIFATSSNFYLLLIAGIIGVISPSGSEIGPFMPIELSALTEVSGNIDRTALMAWYNLFGSLASACGALFCGKVVDYFHQSMSLRDACSLTLLIYGGIQSFQAILFIFLDKEIEVHQHQADETTTHSVQDHSFLGLRQSKWIVFRLSILFMLDAFGGSFVLQSIISAWFYHRYGTASTTLGSIVFYCNIAAGVSALFAVQIAQQIGLILTMVVTHLPSNLLLMLVPLMADEKKSIWILCARYCISQMDVPTRNAYVQGVVSSEERSAANGITNIIRSIGAAAGPTLSGMLLASDRYQSYLFFIAGGLKIAYDLLLLWSFSAIPSSSDPLYNSQVQSDEREKDDQINYGSLERKT